MRLLFAKSRNNTPLRMMTLTRSGASFTISALEAFVVLLRIKQNRDGWVIAFVRPVVFLIVMMSVRHIRKLSAHRPYSHSDMVGS